MKLKMDRKKLTGSFGGTYYESEISVSFTSQEKEVIRKQGWMSADLIGGTERLDEVRLLTLVNVGSLKLQDLVDGQITAKAHSDKFLGELAEFENLMRDRCKNLKQQVDTIIQNTQTYGEGGTYEEEL